MDDATLVAALRRGDERAFAQVVEAFHPVLRRVARGYLRSDDVVGDVVQETWIAVLNGLDRFEGRSSLRTWVVSILVNIARRHAVKEARTVPFSAAAGRSGDGDATFDPDRFQGAGDPYPGHWAAAPTPWTDEPETAATVRETVEAVAEAVAALPRTQRTVVTLRDVEGWTGPEVAAALGISEGNQRVLLHRGRAKVRAALEPHLVRAGARTAGRPVPDGAGGRR
jgi:RNA polymerase sigma-70 factor, ECF subfamily